MNIAQQILDQARSLFDVAGVGKTPGGDALLILGLESSPERDLDEFGQVGGAFQLQGFAKHAAPRLEALANYIQDKGYTTEPIGQYGYPLKRELNLKEAAISAGLGKRGKSTVVLHSKYGPRLRFMAMRTDAPLDSIIGLPQPEEKDPACRECSICIDACPVNALEPYRMPDTSICLSNSSVMTEEHGRLIPCYICLHLCPVGNK
ncbi:hypothetical protein ACFLXF_02300 [Chloroflexota bacterium]